jgi:hypothetical protein
MLSTTCKLTCETGWNGPRRTRTRRARTGHAWTNCRRRPRRRRRCHRWRRCPPASNFPTSAVTTSQTHWCPCGSTATVARRPSRLLTPLRRCRTPPSPTTVRYTTHTAPHLPRYATREGARCSHALAHLWRRHGAESSSRLTDTAPELRVRGTSSALSGAARPGWAASACAFNQLLAAHLLRLPNGHSAINRST